MKKLCLKLFTLYTVCTFGIAWGQTQITITPNKDNTLYESSTGSLSNGAGENFFVGRTNQPAGLSIRRGLAAFDIAGNIPAGATINSVTLTFNMSQTSSGAQTVELHRLLSDWGEGTSNATGGGGGGGAPSTAGDATWIHTFFDTSFWTNIGGDFSATESASHVVSGIGSYTWGSTPQMVGNVQAWLDTPSTNFGWLVLGNESTFPTSKRFDTRENANPAVHPMLTVTYNPIVGVHENTGLPTVFTLHQNYPNPFNPSTTIRYELPDQHYIVLNIYNMLGQEVTRLVDALQTQGVHSVVWNGEDRFGRSLGSGIFIYRLQIGNTIHSKNMLLLK